MRIPPSNLQYRLFVKNLNGFDKNKKYRVLEIGAGDKIIADFLPKNFKYSSLDFGKQHDYNFDLNKKKLPIKSNTFDVIICLETLEHIMYPDEILQEISRIAKKDAVFFISMPNEYNFVQRFYYLIGRKTAYDEPFQVVAKNLHIHKPRVRDILEVISKYLAITEVDYVWKSRHSTEYLRFSSIFQLIDKIIDAFTPIWPSMFSRVVSVQASKKIIN